MTQIERSVMSVQEIEEKIGRLSECDLVAFAKWFEEFMADQWDRQIEADALAGKLDAAAARADEQFEAGLCTALRSDSGRTDQ